MSQTAASAAKDAQDSQQQPISDKSPIRKEDIKRLKEIINEIEDDPKSYEFREPVPWRELGLNDYPEIIKKPMDLKSARSKLVKQKYGKYEDFFKDVQLIWDNCKTYNIQGSDIYKLAEDMEKLSKKAINKAREAIGIIKGKNGSRKPKAAAEESKAAKGADAEMEDEEGNDDDNKSDSEQTEADEVPFEEKVAFTEKVRRLTNEGLTRLVRKVKELCSDALEDVDAEKLHIQVDKIDKRSFGQLQTLVDENLVKGKKGK